MEANTRYGGMNHLSGKQNCIIMASITALMLEDLVLGTLKKRGKITKQ